VLSSASQPSFRRVASLLWFPFFFAAAFTLMGLFAFANPTPHAIPIDAVGTADQANALQRQLDIVAPQGFVVSSVSSPAEGSAALAGNETAAVYAPGHAGVTLAASSAASATRADYLHSVFAEISAASEDAPLTYVDAAPRAAGDASGVGIMFYALPLLLVGLITSIVLLQFGMWPIRKKFAVIAATGAFASTFAFVAATTLDVLPADLMLLVYGFVLTQAIGWLTTAAALLAKQFFMPIAMTFVLILGIPSSGATVNGDMLPGFIRGLNSVLPFAQFVDITRASAYFDGRGIGEPLLILMAWTTAGAALLAVARRRISQTNRTKETA
jgi:hypothetical protein